MNAIIIEPEVPSITISTDKLQQGNIQGSSRLILGSNNLSLFNYNSDNQKLNVYTMLNI